ncbi:hypothetical protein CBM2634_B20084 [Cupriavidus taiwanensis]|uniref:Transposase n=1 Tax=Cupriavidus taiwanensis TaxID=164546 RepID=A0A375J883_9BURK|nr:hypothetical protein CBM2634_B20084 [Cupriavidus taiwanensis]
MATRWRIYRQIGRLFRHNVTQIRHILTVSFHPLPSQEGTRYGRVTSRIRLN